MIMLCPECGTENTEQVESCTQCGMQLKTEARQTTQHASDNSGHETDSVSQPISDITEKRETANQPEQRITNLNLKSDKAANEKPVVSVGLHIVIFLGTLIFPIVGIAMGFVYMRKPQYEARKAGKIWLIFGITMMIINFVIIYQN